jgi:hypothetical protein
LSPRYVKRVAGKKAVEKTSDSDDSTPAPANWRGHGKDIKNGKNDGGIGTKEVKGHPPR